MTSYPIGSRFCALTESDLAGVTTACRWSFPDVLVCQHLHLGGLGPASCDAVLQDILAQYNTACGLNAKATPNASMANIFSQAGQIDGPMGILGVSYLPCGNTDRNTQLSQTLDVAELWPEQQLLLRVWLHEMGHAFGLQHAPEGSGAVMEPYLTGYTNLQGPDIQELQARYGPPLIAPASPPSPAGGDVFGTGVEVDIPKAGRYLIKITSG